MYVYQWKGSIQYISVSDMKICPDKNMWESSQNYEKGKKAIVFSKLAIAWLKV